MEYLQNIFNSNQGEWLLLIGVIILSIQYIKAYRWKKTLSTLMCGLFWIAFYRPVTTFLRTAGIDSFAEVYNFDLREAKFYLDSLPSNFKNSIPMDVALVYVAAGIISFFLLYLLRVVIHKFRHQFVNIEKITAVSCIVWATYVTYRGPFREFIRASRAYTEVEKNFQNRISPLSLSVSSPRVLVYIGESTGIANMSIYGYYRNTNPRLEHLLHTDPGLLLFKNVFSTHTQTTPSLLEALSISVKTSDAFLPINERKRISLVDLLYASGISSYLFSNQGQAGTWNQASSIVFKKAKRVFSVDSRLAGNSDGSLPKPFDSDFFGKNLIPTLKQIPEMKKDVVFLHSQAGHGPYLVNVPPDFQGVLDNSIQSESSLSQKLITNIDNYDSAVRYVDYSIAKTIESLKSFDRPVVMVYFSDHGESAYTGYGHDSAKFVHEMFRIPFLVYFNQRAQKAYPDLFLKYQLLSKSKNISTLAQLPGTIIDILANSKVQSQVPIKAVIGADYKYPLLPVMVRRVGGDVNYVNLNLAPYHLSLDFPTLDKTDMPTSLFLTNKFNMDKSKVYCMDDVQNLATAIRASIVTNCLAIEAQDLNHSILSIVQKMRIKLVIKTEKIQSENDCQKFFELMRPFQSNKKDIVLSPSTACKNLFTGFGQFKAILKK
jgi:glucan phosphoethanolaminetransferase (alkaline phosphatase superfamily)